VICVSTESHSVNWFCSVFGEIARGIEREKRERDRERKERDE